MKPEGDSQGSQGRKEGVTLSARPAVCVLVFQCGTAAMECVRQSISEVLDFMADMHTLTKLKVSALPCVRLLG